MDQPSFLSGDSKMAEAIGRHEWSRSPLGPIDSWPETLKTTVALVLGSRFPAAIVWGPSLITIFNDAFIPILGNKPAALGRPFSDIWSEAWGEIGSMVAAALAGQATYIEDFPLLVERSGALEQAYFTFCYSPIRDGQGRVVGMLDTVTETTKTVVANQRLEFLDQLGRAIADANDADTIMATTTHMVGEHLKLSNCAYAYMDPDEDGFTIRGDWAAEGSPTIVGHYSLADFGTLAVGNLSKGEPLVINDNLAELEPHEAETFQNIGIAATICMPLVKEGQLTALMAIHDRVPRVWSEYDLVLIREVTERSWAHIERVRADAAVREAARALAELNATLEMRVKERTARLIETEAVLRQSQKMEAVGQLTGGLAHDFNNLLTGIGGSLELMMMRLAQGRIADAERYASAAQHSVERAAALTHRLLAFSRRQTLDPKPVMMNRLVGDMEELVLRTAGPAITTTVTPATDLWATMVDPNQLENALLNLCINARDAMPEGGQLTIRTANAFLDPSTAARLDLQPGDYVSLSVSDTGTGMTEETIAKAFDPFFTTKPLGEGTGLGLSMTYGFARQSGGQVQIESKLGSGSTVSLLLPRYDAAVPAETAASISPKSVRAESGEVILVIDDEATVRMLVSDALMESGYRVIEAEDGPAGLELLRSNRRIDLLITDVGLPGGINGRQVADAARVVRPDLKVVFITGYAEQAIFDQQLGNSMSLVTKPFKIEALVQKVRQQLPS